MKLLQVFLGYSRHLIGLSVRLGAISVVVGFPFSILLALLHPGASGESIGLAMTVPVAIVVGVLRVLVERGIITSETLKADPNVKPLTKAQETAAIGLLLAGLLETSAVAYAILGITWATKDANLLGALILFPSVAVFESRSEPARNRRRVSSFFLRPLSEVAGLLAIQPTTRTHASPTV